MAREDFASQDPHRKIGSKKRRACGVTGSSRGRVCQGTTQEQGGSGERQRGECSAAVPAGGRAVRSPQYREGGKEVERSRGVVGDLSQRQEGDHRGGCDQRRACRGIERCESGGIFSNAHGVKVCNSRGPALAPVLLWRADQANTMWKSPGTWWKWRLPDRSLANRAKNTRRNCQRPRPRCEAV